MPGLIELSCAAIAKERLDVCVQKYVAIDDGSFEHVWNKPIECQLELRRFCDDQMIWSRGGALASLSGYIRSIYVPARGSVMPGMGIEADTDDLVGMSMDFCYDCEHKVGIIVSGKVEEMVDYKRKWKQVVAGVDLRVITDGRKLMSEKEMRLNGIPEEILDCPALLREVSRPV